MEFIKTFCMSLKTRTDFGDLGPSLTKSSIATFVLSLIGGIHVIFMGLGYGFSQSPARELTPCTAVILLTTLVTSSVTFLTTRRVCLVTKGSIALVLIVECVFCLLGMVLGFIVFVTDKTCEVAGQNSLAMPLPWKKPRTECIEDPSASVPRYLLAATMFVWFLQILILGRTLELLRQPLKTKSEAEETVLV
jgi:hypothetical protein